MGFFNQTLKHFFAFLLIVFALTVPSSSPASCNEILPKINNTDATDHQPPAAYQVLHVENAGAPFFLNKPGDQGFDKKRKRKMMKRRKLDKLKKNFKTRPFSAMLPKGFVPPSGSSRCHNDKPDSAVGHDLNICGLSSTTTAKP